MNLARVSRGGLALTLTAMAVGGPAQAQEPPGPSPVIFSCTVRCSETRLRTGVAVLSWAGADERTGARSLAAGSTRGVPALETTVFKNGFDQNRFVRIGSLQTGAQPVSSTVSAAAAGDPRNLRAYDLRVGVVQTGEAVSLPEAAALPGDPSKVSVEVEGLEPGLLYTWRLRLPGSNQTVTTTCEAPVCPADMRQEVPR